MLDRVAPTVESTVEQVLPDLSQLKEQPVARALTWVCSEDPEIFFYLVINALNAQTSETTKLREEINQIRTDLSRIATVAIW